MLTYNQFFWKKKLEQELKPNEIKPSIVSIALCIDLHVICVMQIMLVIHAARHLQQRIVEQKYSAIGKHLLAAQ